MYVDKIKLWLIMLQIFFNIHLYMYILYCFKSRFATLKHHPNSFPFIHVYILLLQKQTCNPKASSQEFKSDSFGSNHQQHRTVIASFRCQFQGRNQTLSFDISLGDYSLVLQHSLIPNIVFY